MRAKHNAIYRNDKTFPTLAAYSYKISKLCSYSTVNYTPTCSSKIGSSISRGSKDSESTISSTRRNSISKVSASLISLVIADGSEKMTFKIRLVSVTSSN